MLTMVQLAAFYGPLRRFKKRKLTKMTDGFAYLPNQARAEIETVVTYILYTSLFTDGELRADAHCRASL